MKRLLCALLLVLFVGGVLGCGREAAEKEPTDNEPGASATEKAGD